MGEAVGDDVVARGGLAAASTHLNQATRHHRVQIPTVNAHPQPAGDLGKQISSAAGATGASQAGRSKAHSIGRVADDGVHPLLRAVSEGWPVEVAAKQPQRTLQPVSRDKAWMFKRAGPQNIAVLTPTATLQQQLQPANPTSSPWSEKFVHTLTLWPLPSRLPTLMTRMSMSTVPAWRISIEIRFKQPETPRHAAPPVPSVCAPRWAAGTRMLPVPTKGSYTMLPRRTCRPMGTAVSQSVCLPACLPACCNIPQLSSPAQASHCCPLHLVLEQTMLPRLLSRELLPALQPSTTLLGDVLRPHQVAHCLLTTKMAPTLPILFIMKAISVSMEVGPR